MANIFAPIQPPSPQQQPQQLPPAGPAAPAAPQQVLVNGLRGREPDIFDGSRDRAPTFLRQFQIYGNLNRNHELMTTPYDRVNMALSLIRGPAVEDWVDNQLKEQELKITRPDQPLDRHDETLWHDFKAAFVRAFTDTNAQQKAHDQLRAHRMKSNDLDSYIATFEVLANKAGYDRDARGTIDYFVQGLSTGLRRAVIYGTAKPITLTEWINAARDEFGKHATFQSYTDHNARPGWTTFRTQPMRQTQQSAPPPKYSRDQVVPMDVDSIRKATTEEAKIAHRKEGRCFECSKQGHMARDCPNKPKRPTKPPSIKFISQLEADSDDEEHLRQKLKKWNHDPLLHNNISIPDLAARTAKFSVEDREKWVDEMKKLGVDFQ